MSDFWTNVRAWAGPRRWSIVGGLLPVLGLLFVIGSLSQNWGLFAGGVVGLLIWASGVLMFVGRPELWDDPVRRWRVLGLWVFALTAICLVVVIVVFLAT